MGFQETDIHSLEFNLFDKISKQWMLITAGNHPNHHRYEKLSVGRK